MVFLHGRARKNAAGSRGLICSIYWSPTGTTACSMSCRYLRNALKIWVTQKKESEFELCVDHHWRPSSLPLGAGQRCKRKYLMQALVQSVAIMKRPFFSRTQLIRCIVP